jgi:hypothetical protein
MKKITIPCLILSLFVLPYVCGCGPSNPLDTIVVTGTVTVDGQPMEGIRITFIPMDGGAYGAFGTTDSRGRFRLSSPSAPVGSGAVAGEYIPVFSKVEVEERPPTDSPEEERILYGGAPPKVTHLIPEKYGDVKTGGFDPVTVEKGKKNEFTFDLSTQ